MRYYFNFVAMSVVAAILVSLPLPAAGQSRGLRSPARGVVVDPKETVDIKTNGLAVCESGKFDFAAGPGTVVGSGHGNSRTYSSNGSTVTVRAFSRAADTGTWETATVGQWNGAGIGVSNRDPNEGTDPNHKIDNVGNRKDYVLLEFSQPILVPTAYLSSISTDSDMRVWFGNSGPVSSLSDAILSSFTQAANGGNAANSSRSADLSGSAVAGNKLVIAAETLGTDLDDYFKVEAIDFSCPPPPPPPVTNLIVIKEVLTVDLTNSSTQSFAFTSTNTNQPNFSLVDNNSVVNDRAELSVPAGATATIVENQPLGWSLSDLACTGTAAGNINVNFGAATVSVTPQANELVTCTFTNAQARASAASVELSGRATLMDSRGVGGAIVTLQNLSTGERRSVTTNTLGYYSISDVEVGQFYMVSITHRRYRFAENSRFFTLEENLSGVDFVGGF